MQREPQHGLIVTADEFLEGGTVPALRLSDEDRIVYAAFLPCHSAQREFLVFTKRAFADSVPVCPAHWLTRSVGTGPSTYRKCHRQNIGRHVFVLFLLARINAVSRACIEIDEV
jgi:hypothetical protein